MHVRKEKGGGEEVQTAPNGVADALGVIHIDDEARLALDRHELETGAVTKGLGIKRGEVWVVHTPGHFDLEICRFHFGFNLRSAVMSHIFIIVTYKINGPLPPPGKDVFSFAPTWGRHLCHTLIMYVTLMDGVEGRACHRCA